MIEATVYDGPRVRNTCNWHNGIGLAKLTLCSVMQCYIKMSADKNDGMD